MDATTKFGIASSIGLVVVLARSRVQRRILHKKRRTKLPDFCESDPAHAKQVSKSASSSSSQKAEAAEQRIIVDFEDLRKDQAWLVGGKGANLGELVSAGFPVPSGFCITKLAFEAHLRRPSNTHGGKSLWSVIEESSELPPSAAQALITKSPISNSCREAILSSYRNLCRRLGKENAVVAVRSSATAEDSADASFAGQLDTFLGISGEENVVQAVLECWASLYSDRVDSYRKLAGRGRGTATSSISVCVVVQEMLDADSAGVMFTANPFTQNLDEIVVTGNWGLGESVVADIASPDTWIVKLDANLSNYEVLSESIAVKKKKVVLVPKAKVSHGGCSETVDIVSPQEQTSPCITRDQLRALADLGRKIQKHYGNHPQDTEWGIKNGKVYLLQARPITTLSDEPARTINEFDTPCRPDDWITTCNAAEMFPGPMTPLTMSTFGRMADQGVQRMQILFGCRKKVDLQHRVTANYSGHFFLNMTNTLAPMCSGMIGAQMAKDNGEMSILGALNHGETLERLFKIAGGQRYLPIRLLNGMRYAMTMLTAPFRVPIMRSRIHACEKEFSKVSKSQPSAAVLWSEIDSMMDAYDDQWTDGIITSSTSAAAMLFAMKLLTEPGGDVWGAKPVAEIAMLLGQQTEGGLAESAGPVESIDRLRDTILTDHADSASAFAGASPEEALGWLQSRAGINKEFSDLLERHGHRCVREAEMREKDWSEDSLPLIRMLQSSVRAGLARKGDAPTSQHGNSAADAEKLLASKKHLNFITRGLLKRAVNITRRSVHLRELGKSLQVKLNAVFKHAYRHLGAIMVSEGRLPEADLLYFLTHQEIGELACAPLSHTVVHRLKTRATQRRRLLAQQVHLRFPELVQGAPKPLQKSTGAEGVAGTVFQGTAVSAGSARGPARVARTLEDAEALQEGEILITPQTDVGWTPYFSIAAGLVTEIGGMLSHGAVVAREYSLPCVVGVTDACDVIRTGSIVHLDGDTGRLTVISIA